MSAPSFATSWQRLHQSHRWTTSAHIPKPYLWRKWKRGGSVLFYDILIFTAESLWRFRQLSLVPRVHNFTYLQRDFNNAGGLVTIAWWSQLYISPIKLCFAIYFRVHMSSSKLCLVLLFSFLREKARTRLGGCSPLLGLYSSRFRPNKGFVRFAQGNSSTQRNRGAFSDALDQIFSRVGYELY